MSAEAKDASKSRKPRKEKRTKAAEDVDEPQAVAVDAGHDMQLETAERKKKNRKSKSAGESYKEDSTTPKVIDNSDGPKEKKRKKRKAELQEDAPAVETSVDGSSSVHEKKRRHKKKKEVEAPENEAEQGPLLEDSTPQESKKKSKKAKTLAEGEGNVTEKAIPLKEQKKQQETETSEAHEDEISAKKEKKRKRKVEKAEGEEQIKPKKRKSRKAEHNFPDPSEDESLTDQARKALHYAFLQFNDPGSWKFNKARQNWLIRNIWLAEAIPETHMPLLVRYLAGVQGGVRDALIKACRENLTAQVSPRPDATQEPAEGEATPATDNASTKQSRATAILSVLNPQT